MRFATILVMTGLGAMGQTPAFEVASIKPSSPFLQAVADGSLIGMTIGPGRVSIGHLDLSKLIQTAYNIKKFQLAGPDWLMIPPDPASAGGFDIEAKLPAGSTAGQVPLMLQAMLADRFKLKIRRESREFDTYGLMIGKDGLKINKKDAAGESLDSRVFGTQGPNGQSTFVSGATKVTTAPGAGTRVETSTIAGLVEYLSSRMPLPVVDKTGLTDSYDIKLEILPGGTAGGVPDLEVIRASAMLSLVTAVKKLGLDLVPQKNRLETIVVESAERNPTGN